MLILFIYAAALVVIGALDCRRIRGFDDYILAGRKRSTWLVGSSILASAVGASATLGVVKLAWQVGAPAFWWLGAGGIGLILGSLFVAPSLPGRGVYTLPDLAENLLGPTIRIGVALAIVVGWTGIIAAQFVAAARIVQSIGDMGYGPALVASVAFIGVYCLLGGQSSVLKTDAVQIVLLCAGLLAAVVFLSGARGDFAGRLSLALVTEDFGPNQVLYFLLVIGSGFFVGPDIFGRYFTAAD